MNGFCMCGIVHIGLSLVNSFAFVLFIPRTQTKSLKRSADFLISFQSPIICPWINFEESFET